MSGGRLDVPQDSRYDNYASVGPFGEVLADYRRSYLALLAAKHVAPIYVSAFRRTDTLRDHVPTCAAKARTVVRIVSVTEGMLHGTTSYDDGMACSAYAHQTGYDVDLWADWAESQDLALATLAMRGCHAFWAAWAALSTTLDGYHPVAIIEARRQQHRDALGDGRSSGPLPPFKGHAATNGATIIGREDAAGHGALAVSWNGQGRPPDAEALRNRLKSG